MNELRPCVILSSPKADEESLKVLSALSFAKNEGDSSLRFAPFRMTASEKGLKTQNLGLKNEKFVFLRLSQ